MEAASEDNYQLKTNTALQTCCDGAAARRVEPANLSAYGGDRV